MKKGCVLALLLWCLSMGPASAQVEPRPEFKAPGPNIALHKHYTLTPEPNYAHCSKDPDRVLLTDGVYTKGQFWTHPTTVGWGNRPMVDITIDLGKTEPIAGASYRTAGGAADVNWPRSVLVFVSDDNKDFRPAGDLVMDSARFGLPAREGYAVHRYVSNRLKAKGRYVKILVDQIPEYCFCDEIEIYRGPDALLDAPQADVVDLKAYLVRNRINACTRRRLFTDLQAVSAAVEASALSAEKKAEAKTEFETLRTQIENLPPVNPEGFRAILPLNDIDRRLFAWRGAALKAKGWPDLVVWKRNRWDPLEPMDAPEVVPDPPPSLDIQMMLNEYRSDAFNLTNVSERPLRVTMTMEGLPDKLLSVRHVPIVDTSTCEATADALPEAERTDAGFALDVAAGMNTQVWLLAHSAGIEPGSHSGKARVRTDRGQEVVLPVNVRIYPLRFPERPRLSLSGCEYSDSGLGYGVTPQNLNPLLQFLREHYVDSPWAHSGVLSFPKAEDFDDQDRLRGKLDFSKLDEWLDRWPKAPQYFVYPARTPGSGFAGAKMGTPGVDRRIAAWTEAFNAHVQSRGLKPNQFYLLVVDEPTEELQCRTISAWAKAMRPVKERPLVWVTFYACPKADFFQEMFPLCDMLCPHIPGFIGWDEEGKSSALKHVEGDRFLWLYSAIGPSRTLDPYTYYRLLPWLCYRYGAKGCIFWAFGDSGGCVSSWNDYLTAGKQYCPQYMEPDRMTDSKQWQGIIEGMQDHELLSMLADRVRVLGQAGAKGEKLDAARQLLNRAAMEVTDGLKLPALKWAAPKDRSTADRVRIEALEMLMSLSG